MADRFAIASGNWSSPATWSVSRSGAAGASVPGPDDTAYTDDHLLLLDGNVDVYGIVAEGVNDRVNAAAGSNLNIGEGGVTGVRVRFALANSCTLNGPSSQGPNSFPSGTTFNITGDYTLSGTSVGALTITGTGTTTGTITVNGNLSIANGAQVGTVILKTDAALVSILQWPVKFLVAGLNVSFGTYTTIPVTVENRVDGYVYASGFSVLNFYYYSDCTLLGDLLISGTFRRYGGQVTGGTVRPGTTWRVPAGNPVDSNVTWVRSNAAASVVGALETLRNLTLDGVILSNESVSVGGTGTAIRSTFNAVNASDGNAIDATDESNTNANGDTAADGTSVLNPNVLFAPLPPDESSFSGITPGS